MVPFNVLRQEGGHFHRGTSGALVVEAPGDGAEAPLAAALRQAGFEVECRADVLEVAWGKLLVNLGNALNALTGLPLREQLAQRAYRVLYSRAIAEGVAALRRAGIRPSLPMPLPPGLVPFLLRLPDVLFLRLARSMVQIDPHARSSMWEDLERGRTTEIDQLNGQVVRLATAHGLRAPVNEAIVALVREAEAAQRGSPQLRGPELTRRLAERGG
jgi:2-dehydropantoate 2-reductase